MIRGVLITTAVLLVPAGAAHASTVSMKTLQGDEPYSQVKYTAAAGETNNLAITRSGLAVTFTDTGAPVTAASEGCVAADEHTVTCTRPTDNDETDVEVDLGDQDDTETVTIGTPNSAEYVVVNSKLGAGNDTVTTDNGGENEGEAGDDLLTAVTRGGDLRGGPGNDVLSALKGGAFLDGGSGRDQMHAGPGHDVIETDQRGEIAKGDCGTGPDWVYVTGTARDALVPADCERAALHNGELIADARPIRRAATSVLFGEEHLTGSVTAELRSSSGALLAPAVKLGAVAQTKSLKFTYNAAGKRAARQHARVRVVLRGFKGAYFTTQL